MQCKKCKAFFIRPPCPECGWSEEKEGREEHGELVRPSSIVQANSSEDTLRKPSEMLQAQKLEQQEELDQSSETLRKPSEILKQQQESSQKIGEERLRKPSEILKNNVPPAFEEEHLRKPSDVVGEYRRPDSLVRPSEVLEQDKQENVESKPSYRDQLVKSSQKRSFEIEPSSSDLDDGLLRPSELKGTSGRTVKSISQHSINTNRKYIKKDVKATLEEVINLLEKLIEDE